MQHGHDVRNSSVYRLSLCGVPLRVCDGARSKQLVGMRMRARGPGVDGPGMDEACASETGVSMPINLQ